MGWEKTGRLQVTRLQQSGKTDCFPSFQVKGTRITLESIVKISSLSHPEVGYHSPRPAVTTVKVAQRRRRNAWEGLLGSSRICVHEFFTLKELLPLERGQLHTFSPGSLQDQLGVRQEELACTGQES